MLRFVLASLMAVSATNSRHGAGLPNDLGPSSAWSWWWARASSATGFCESMTVIGRARSPALASLMAQALGP